MPEKVFYFFLIYISCFFLTIPGDVFSCPVVPLFLTIPNVFASLETVYIKLGITSQYQPLFSFKVKHSNKYLDSDQILF